MTKPPKVPMRVAIEVTRSDGHSYWFVEFGRVGSIVRRLLTNPWTFEFKEFDGSIPHDAYVHLCLRRDRLMACLPRSTWVYVKQPVGFFTQ